MPSKAGCIDIDKRTGKFDIELQKQENLNYVYSFPSLKEFEMRHWYWGIVRIKIRLCHELGLSLLLVNMVICVLLG